ncbi:MAG: hypothetical protein ACRDRH_16130 [Pseudonocardia sp.]
MLDRRERGGSAFSLPVQSAAGKATVSRPEKIAPRELRMLAALCEPLLRYAGEDARAATNAEIADRLSLKAEYVRRSLSDLRDRLSTAHGMPRLRPEDDGALGRGFGDLLAASGRSSTGAT